MAEAEWVSDDGEGGVAEIVHIDSSIALTASDKAQIDIQIATAKKYPRDLARFRRDALALVASDEETASSMFYALPRRQFDREARRYKTVHIEGPSVRFAEVMVYCWGNLRVEARVVAIDDTHVTSQGTCMDLEKNIGCRVEVKRRITDSNGKRYSEDMIVTTGNAASAIAFRNAVFKVVPFSLARSIYEHARHVATGGAEPIEARRQKALAWYARVGVPEDRLLAQLDVQAVDDITEDHLVILTGIKNAIQEGTTTVEAAFPRAAEQTPGHAQELNEQLRARKAGNGGNATAKAPPTEPKATKPTEDRKTRASLDLLMAAFRAHMPDVAGDDPDSRFERGLLAKEVTGVEWNEMTREHHQTLIQHLQSLPKADAAGSTDLFGAREPGSDDDA